MRSLLAVLAIAASVAAQNSTSNTTLASALTSNSNLSTLVALATKAGLVSALNGLTNVTILAPSNAAFSKFGNTSATANATVNDNSLLQALLTYHILNGTINSSQITSTPTFVPTHLVAPAVANVTGGQVVEAINSNGTVSILSGLFTNSTVTQANIPFNNGIIHIVDTVLQPPQKVSSTAEQAGLSAVVGALTKTNLVSTVDNTPDLTIFAPNNSAFAAIANIVQNASVDTLTSVLKYHVIAGKVLYSPAITNTTLQTLNGASINVEVVNGSVFVNQAKVLTPNVLVANGVVHVIDNVLNPATNATAGSNSTAFASATSSSAIPFTSGVPTPSSTLSVPSGVSATTTGSSSSTNVAAKAMATGAIGAGMLFAGAFMAL